MGCFCCAVLLGLLATQVLAQENELPNWTAGSSSYPGTTEESGFFRRVFNAARGLVYPVQYDASTPLSTTTPSSPAASPHALLWLMKEPPLRGIAPLNFSLRVLNGDLSVAEEPDSYDEGSAILLEARVQTSPGVLLPKIFIDKCYGTDTKEAVHPRRLYVIADNHGCLYPKEAGTAASWFRKGDSVIVLTMPAFSVTEEPVEEIYIHCLLTAWSPKTPTSPSKKTCYFSRDLSSWKNIDEPFKPSVCNCCDHVCPTESSHLGNFKESFVGEGRLHREVVGPLLVRKGNILQFEGHPSTIKDLIWLIFAYQGSYALASLLVTVVMILIMCCCFCWLPNKLLKSTNTEAWKMFRSLEAKFPKEINVSNLEHSREERPHDPELKRTFGPLRAEFRKEMDESNLENRRLERHILGKTLVENSDGFP